MGEGRDVEVLDMDEDEGIADDTIDHSGMDGLEDDRTTRYAL